MSRKFILKKSSDSQFPWVSSVDEGQAATFASNEIRTSHYSIFPFAIDFFLWKNLYEQFQRKANLYFLVIAILQLVPGWSPTGRYTTLATLVAVISFSAAKSAYEDSFRHKNDRVVNARTITANGVERRYRDIKVGDIVECTHDIPCDMLLLASDAPGGGCYVETSNLDGETNLKPKQCLVLLGDEGVVEYENPNKNLYEFNGTVTTKSNVLSIHPDFVLLRGTVLRKAKLAIGVALYTGLETKVFKNSATNGSSHKSSQVERNLNKYLASILIVQFILCLISTLGYAYGFEAESAWYMQPKSRQPPYILLFTFIILFNNLIPISLYVSLELIRFLQGRLLEEDLGMYYEAKEKRMVARSTNINEELGQITHIFSDKTGTLTRNVMKFMKFALPDGECYGKGMTEIGHAAARRRGQVIDEERPPAILKRHEYLPVQCWDPRLFADLNETTDWALPGNPSHMHKICELFSMLSVCHTVVVDGGKYEAESPDELALVEAAKFFRFEFKSRTLNSSGGFDIETTEGWFEILHVFEFTAERKRMSVVARKKTENVIIMYTKGADSVMLPRVTDKEANLDAINKALANFGDDGLRTLVCCSKIIPESVYLEWFDRFLIQQKLLNKAALLSLQDELEETGFVMVGVTAIEDKLQDFVPDVIANLRAAQIAVWMLTGDKQETAINIAYACNLLSDDMRWVVLKTLGDLHEASNQNTVQGVVFQGDFLNNISSDQSRWDLYSVLTKCSSVVCCRVSPKQKAEVIELIRSYNNNNITLAIGDGANDVPMIRAAHVGVGISGMEGQQASNAADYAFGQFQYLQRLLLVHGHQSYVRQTTTITYCFYKNAVYVFTQFFFCIWNGWSGQSLYEQWELALYNVLFTFLPIIAVGVFDRPILNTNRYIEFPQLYQESQQNRLFTLRVFLDWIFTAVWHAALCMFILLGTLAASEWNTLDEAGTALYVVVILTVTATLCIRGIYAYAWPITFCIFVSICSLVIFLPVYGELALFDSMAAYRVAQHLVQTPLWLLYGAWLIVGSQSKDFLLRYLRQYRTDLGDKVRRMDAIDGKSRSIPNYLPVLESHDVNHKTRVVQGSAQTWAMEIQDIVMHPLTLAFSNHRNLELEFIDTYLGNLDRYRMCSICGVIGGSLIVLGSFLGGDYPFESGLWILFTVTCFMLTYFLYRSPSIKEFLHPLMCCVMAIGFSTSSIATLYSSMRDPETHPLTVGIVLLGVLVLLRPPFRYALVYLFLGALCYGGWYQLFRVPSWKAQEFTARVAELSVISILGLTMLRQTEKGSRQSFLASVMLQKQTEHLQNEENRSIELLCNVLPLSIVKEIRDNHREFEDFSLYYDSCSALVSDIVGFTVMTSSMDTARVVEMLNFMFTKFDQRCSVLGCEKIKTIGDAYVCIAGAPKTNKYHYEMIAQMGLSMMNCLVEMNSNPLYANVKCRIGIGMGSGYTGIVGVWKICYDVFGEVIRLAEDMEHTGMESKVQCSENMAAPLRAIGFEIEQIGSQYFVVQRLFCAHLDRNHPSIIPLTKSDMLNPASAPQSPQTGNPLNVKTWLRREKTGSSRMLNLLGHRSSMSDRSGTPPMWKNADMSIDEDILEGDVKNLTFDRWTLRFTTPAFEKQFLQSKMKEIALRRAVVTAILGCSLAVLNPLFVFLTYTSNALRVSEPFLYVTFLNVVTQLVGTFLLMAVKKIQTSYAAGKVLYLTCVSMQYLSIVLFCSSTMIYYKSATTVGAFLVLPYLILVFTSSYWTYTVKCLFGFLAVYLPFLAWLFIARALLAVQDYNKDFAAVIGVSLALVLLQFGARTLERSARTTYLNDLQVAHQKADTAATLSMSEELLVNILPRSILRRMKANSDQQIMDRVETATCMFVYFDNSVTESTNSAEALKNIKMLNAFIEVLDTLTTKFQAEKIKTHPFLVVAGCPEPTLDHAVKIVRLALEIKQVLSTWENTVRIEDSFRKTKFRIGIHSGPLSAGVLGTTKFLYDVFGDTVNVASRLASSADWGMIQTSDSTAQFLGNELDISCARRGDVALKGKGTMSTYVLSKQNEVTVLDSELPRQLSIYS
eukprot:PhF_6_TR25448/c0_g1_i1/m.35186/K14802/DRS2, ATP8A; phospholipid-transporting ATPase